MEEYMKQYNVACKKLEMALDRNKNIILCGPDASGKTHLFKKFRDLLNVKKYNVYFGADHYFNYHNMNGRTCGFNNETYWMEIPVSDKIRLANIFDDEFEFIELYLKYPL